MKAAKRRSASRPAGFLKVKHVGRPWNLQALLSVSPAAGSAFAESLLLPATNIWKHHV